MNMKLSEFTEAMRSDLARFEADWLKRREARPKTYPLELDDGEWYEHFLVWMTMQQDDV